MPIGLFIDGAYVFKTYPGGRVDYAALRNYIEREVGDAVDEGYFFNADDDPPRAQGLHNRLSYPPPNGPGLRVKIYWLSRKKLYWPASMGGAAVVHPQSGVQYELVSQKAVDVGLVYHMTRSFLKRGWKTLVLAAGDGDFHEPVQNLVENENVNLYLVGTMNTISQDLRPYARRVFELDKEPLQSTIRLGQQAGV